MMFEIMTQDRSEGELHRDSTISASATGSESRSFSVHQTGCACAGRTLTTRTSLMLSSLPEHEQHCHTQHCHTPSLMPSMVQVLRWPRTWGATLQALHREALSSATERSDISFTRTSRISSWPNFPTGPGELPPKAAAASKCQAGGKQPASLQTLVSSRPQPSMPKEAQAPWEITSAMPPRQHTHRRAGRGRPFCVSRRSVVINLPLYFAAIMTRRALYLPPQQSSTPTA